ELKGKPVIIGADPKEGKGRGVVSSASYEARKFGVKSAMPISRAWKLCPDGVYLRPHFDLYIPASNNVMKILKSHADKFEQGGIDEAYLDISNRVSDFDEAREFAKHLMEEVFEKEKLTCSIGVGPNKMIAKVASDFRKPCGLTVVKKENVKDFLFPLKVRKIPGVGPKTERILKEINIEIIRDLASAKPEMLTELFGSWGARLYEFANGIDSSEVIEEYETKSVGRDTTFEKDIDNEEQILQVLDGLAEEVHEDVVANVFKFKTITVRVRYQHFETHTRSKSLLFPTNDLDILKNNAKRLIGPLLRGNKKIRLIGIRVSNLIFHSENISRKTTK
ncbi:MAG: DNA polymerase IV, partial [Methanotrichaceae archaeon]|nr:DNA polymerase IV [Methanotrichaceae archaeon]